MRPPDAVLAQYPAPFAFGEWQPLGNAGGFSGARLWKAAVEGRPFCLRAWPAGTISRDRLRFIHSLQEKARYHGLDFVPILEVTRSGETSVETGGRFWEVTDWLPGKADFRDDPSDVRLLEAVRAVARIHGVWARVDAGFGPCPAVERRLRAINDWLGLTESGWRPIFDGASSDDVAHRLWESIPARLPSAVADLLSWRDVPVPLQPCLCDVWHDHILYEGTTVSGVIDYGQAKVDGVAVDLARLLGSLVPGEPGRTAGALFMYGQFRPLFRGADDLVSLLDRTGVLVGSMNWLRWLYLEKRTYPDAAGVARRLEALASRLTAYDAGGS